jgi:hypothetical protein
METPVAMSVSWAFIGLLSGIWKIAAVAAVAGYYVWRKGYLRHPLIRLLRPWAARATQVDAARAGPRSPRPVARPRWWVRALRDRWTLLLFIAVVSALLAWVLARMTIPGAVGSPGG